VSPRPVLYATRCSMWQHAATATACGAEQRPAAAQPEEWATYMSAATAVAGYAGPGTTLGRAGPGYAGPGRAELSTGRAKYG
jgi:hypothetical protein